MVLVADPLNVLSDRRDEGGVNKVLADRPRNAKESAEQPHVSEGIGGVLRRVLRAEEPEQAFLQVQGFRAGARAVNLADLVQADAARAAVAACLSRLQRQAALEGVQSGAGGVGDELPPGPVAGVLLGAALAQEPAVPDTDERERQVPDPLPRSPVLPLDGAAVPGQAVGAVAQDGAEQPAVEDDAPLDAGDATELAELLGFLGDWLESDCDNLTASLVRFIGSTAYGPGSLREDFARFRFLLGVTDGEGLFAPGEP